MNHRGPDGILYKGPLTFATRRRLSIIDVKRGHEPMASDDGRFVIIFKGEIYNFKEIRAVLLQRGYPIKTNSDTETLAFIDAGADCFSQLNGMFAFAIWDNIEQQHGKVEMRRWWSGGYGARHQL